MNPDLQPFLETWARKWQPLAEDATPEERRIHFEGIAADMRLPTPDDVDTAGEHWIETSAGSVRVRAFRPRAGGRLPALVYMHGGGWTQGSPETHWDITARLASWVGAAVFSVDYALAPECPWPMALNQVAGVLKWVREAAADLDVDPDRIAVGGDSAGGNLAACAALKLRGQADAPMAQLLIYPSTDFTASRPSFAENPNGPIIETRHMPKTWSNYVNDPADRLNPLAAPMQAKDHSNLPPAYVAVAQYDPLRDDGLAYADALETAGVPVCIDRGTGLIHGYLRAMGYCADSEAKLRAMADWLGETYGAVRSRA